MPASCRLEMMAGCKRYGSGWRFAAAAAQGVSALGVAQERGQASAGTHSDQTASARSPSKAQKGQGTRPRPALLVTNGPCARLAPAAVLKSHPTLQRPPPSSSTEHLRKASLSVRHRSTNISLLSLNPNCFAHRLYQITTTINKMLGLKIFLSLSLVAMASAGNLHGMKDLIPRDECPAPVTVTVTAASCGAAPGTTTAVVPGTTASSPETTPASSVPGGPESPAPSGTGSAPATGTGSAPATGTGTGSAPATGTGSAPASGTETAAPSSGVSGGASTAPAASTSAAESSAVESSATASESSATSAAASSTAAPSSGASAIKLDNAMAALFAAGVFVALA